MAAQYILFLAQCHIMSPLGQADGGDVNIVQGNDVLMDEAKVGQQVVVIGARYIGMEAAVKLAKEGKDVSLVQCHIMSPLGQADGSLHPR